MSCFVHCRTEFLSILNCLLHELRILCARTVMTHASITYFWQNLLAQHNFTLAITSLCYRVLLVWSTRALFAKWHNQQLTTCFLHYYLLVQPKHMSIIWYPLQNWLAQVMSEAVPLPGESPLNSPITPDQTSGAATGHPDLVSGQELGTLGSQWAPWAGTHVFCWCNPLSVQRCGHITTTLGCESARWYPWVQDYNGDGCVEWWKMVTCYRH